jgi:hypothetical protein
MGRIGVLLKTTADLDAREYDASLRALWEAIGRKKENAEKAATLRALS